MSDSNAMGGSELKTILLSEAYTTAGPADAGTAIDLSTYEGLLAFSLQLKNLAGTNPTLDVKVVHCATSGGTYTDVSGGAFTQSTGATTNATNPTQTVLLDKRNLHRYVKINVTVGGTSNPSYAIAAGVRSMKKVQP